MNMFLLILFSAVLSVLLTLLIRTAATRCGILDRPGAERKVHGKATPLLGGIAVYTTVCIAVLLLLGNTDALTGGEIVRSHYAGFLIGGLILMVGGYLDDRYDIPPKLAIVAPVLAAAAAVAFGIEVDKLTNPFGGVIELAGWQSDLLVFLWLLVVMYTTKFLDGLDGLAAGVSAIGAFMVMCLALTAAYFQPDVATLAAVCLGALLGFLAFNVHPASIFLGEGGSTFVGYALGTLAVISGGKLATALLVIAIPLLDAAWIMVRRFRAGGIRRIFVGDRRHLHHRLLDRGWGQRRIVLGYYAVALLFGASALLLQSREKLFALAALAVLMLGVAVVLTKEERRV